MEGLELGGEQQFCLRWNNFQANITSQFEALRDDEDFVDVTLACEGHRLQAHKVVLSACSPYFKELFKSNPCPHPIIFMRDCELIHVTALLEFMYAGEVNIAQAQLTAFLRTAEALQIRGLTDSSDKNKNEPKIPPPKSQSSQLRNLLCGKLRQQVSPAKDSSQNEFNESYQKTAKQMGQSRRGRHEHEAARGVPPLNGIPGNSSYTTPTRSNLNCEMKDEALRLKERLMMTNQNEDENYSFNLSENNPLLLNELDNQGKINPFAVGNVGYDTEFSHEMLEPKIEVPDYNSEDDTRQERAFNPEVLFGSDGSAQLSNPFMALQGDVTAGPSQDIKGELEGLVGLGRRGWLDLPTLQHQRRILSKHDLASSPPRLIKLGDGIELLEEQVRAVKWADYRKLTRSLAALLFSPAELATCSVTGQRWSRAGVEERPTKPPLDRHKVQAIIAYVSRRFPLIEVSRIKQVLAYKCKENCTALRMKTVSDGGPSVSRGGGGGGNVGGGASGGGDPAPAPDPPQHPPDQFK